MKNFVKTAGTKAIAVAVATSFMATTALPVFTADAGERYGNRKHVERHYHGKRHHKRRHKHRRDNTGAIIGAGIIGLAVGAIIADSNNRRRDRVERDYYDDGGRRPLSQVREDYDYEEYDSYENDGYYEDRGGRPIPLGEPRPTVKSEDAPTVITYEDSVIEPWTVEWYRYCENKYRSFEAETGTFTGYDGKKRFCVPK